MTEEEKRVAYRGIPRECIEGDKPVPFYGGMVGDQVGPLSDGLNGGPGSFAPVRKVMPDGSLKVVQILG